MLRKWQAQIKAFVTVQQIASAASSWWWQAGGHGTLAQANVCHISSFEIQRGERAVNGAACAMWMKTNIYMKKHTFEVRQVENETKKREADEFHSQLIKAVRTESPLGCAPFTL